MDLYDQDKLTFRNLHEGDLDAIHDISSQWSVVRQLGSWPWPPDRAFTQSRCKPYDGDGFVWAICLDGDVCGSLAVTGQELGYALHPSVAGRGIMTFSVRHAITTAFAMFDLDRIAASTWADNIASKRILDKCGFTHWQTRFEHARARGLPVQSNYFRLDRSDWTA